MVYEDKAFPRAIQSLRFGKGSPDKGHSHVGSCCVASQWLEWSSLLRTTCFLLRDYNILPKKNYIGASGPEMLPKEVSAKHEM